MATPGVRLAFLRDLDTLRMDLLLGALVLAEGLLELGLTPFSVDQRAGGAVCVALIATGVGLRRRAPPLALVVGFGGLLAAGTSPTLSDELVGPYFAVVLLLVLGAATVATGRSFAVVAALTTGLALAVALSDAASDGLEEVFWSLVFVAAIPLLAGRMLGARAELNRTLRARADGLDDDREARAAHAVAEERARIADGLHDVVAHALTGMVVQASAARRLVDSDPDRARDTFAAVERSGREALDEMRLLLGVLRREEDVVALRPQPGLASLASLLRRVREEGLAVELDVEGAVTPLAPGVDLVAYRVVQEAISEALSQGAARHATVSVRYGPEQVELDVLDDGVAPDGGRTLPGVRERVTIHGGELSIGARRPGPGHAVRARIPVGARP